MERTQSVRGWQSGFIENGVNNSFSSKGNRLDCSRQICCEQHDEQKGLLLESEITQKYHDD